MLSATTIAFVILDVANRPEAHFSERLSSDFSNSVDCRSGQRAKKSHLLLLGDAKEAVWLSVVACDFCEEFVRADSNTGREPSFLTDQILHLPAKGYGGGFFKGFKPVAHVEVGFIYGDLFDLSTEGSEPRHDCGCFA